MNIRPKLLIFGNIKLIYIMDAFECKCLSAEKYTNCSGRNCLHGSSSNNRWISTTSSVNSREGYLMCVCYVKCKQTVSAEKADVLK